MKIMDWQEYFTDTADHTITGNVKLIDCFPMPQLERERRIWIYLPPDYDVSDRHYPVLYMHDGQNIFDEKTANLGEWHVDETLENLCASQPALGTIVVGIDNGQGYRGNEYCPWKCPRISGGEGLEYVQFIIDTLKPFIDENFRTLSDREHTGIAGSSLGGFISLYAGLQFQEIFSKVGAFSTAFLFAREEMFNFIRSTTKQFPMKIYLDVGKKEHCMIDNDQYENDSMQAYEMLQKIGFSREELKLVVDSEGVHNEEYWAKRFPEAFLWMFTT